MAVQYIGRLLKFCWTCFVFLISIVTWIISAPLALLSVFSRRDGEARQIVLLFVHKMFLFKETFLKSVCMHATSLYLML